MSNVAEGFERGAKTEFVQFLYIAKGSCGEARVQLQIAHDQQYISDSDHRELHDLARRVSGMLSNLIGHLQSTAYQGEKFARPHRQAAQAHEDRIEALRAAQLRSIRAQAERDKRNPDSQP